MDKLYWLRVGLLGASVIVTGLSGAIPVKAQDITEFRNGYLTFTNENPALYYRVEFKPNLTDDSNWDGSFRGLRNIHSSAAEVTVPVGVIYRVVGRETPWVAGTAIASDLLSGKTAYVDDEQITGTMPSIGQQIVMPDTNAQIISAGYHDGTGFVVGDPDLVAENIVAGVSIFGVTGTHECDSGATFFAAVPKTGQTTAYQLGDDGNIRAGVAWPSPRFSIQANTNVVLDNITGLQWARNANLAGEITWSNALVFCNNLEYGGYSDWRLPNRRELFSLIDDKRTNPCLPAGHPFNRVQSAITSADYWTSTTRRTATTFAYYINLRDSTMFQTSKTREHYVWPVRGP